MLPPVYPFIIIFSISQLVLFFSLRKRQISAALPFVGVIVGSTVGYYLGLSTMSVIVCAVFLYFRISAFIRDSENWTKVRTQLALLFYCTGLMIFLFSWLSKYPYINSLYIIVIIFTAFFIIGRYLQQVDESSYDKNFFSFAGLLGVITLLTMLLSFIVPVLKWAFFGLLNGLISIVALAAKPLFDFIEGIYIESPVNEQEEETEVEMGNQAEEFTDSSVLGAIPQWVWFLVIAVILVAIVLYLWKKKMSHETISEQINLNIAYASLPQSNKPKRRIFRSNQPENNLRRLLYQLQMYAQKRGLGRHEYETVREWFDRIGISNQELVIETYDAVRYGNGVLTKNEEVLIEERIRGIKKEIKEQSKINEVND